MCTIIGACLAASLFVMRTRGYFERWHELAVAPPGAIDLLSDETGIIHVKTSSNETYRLEWREGNEYWVKDEVSQGVAEVQPVEVTKPCDFSSPEFSLLTNTPANSIDCIQIFIPQADGFVRYAYILDQDGKLWYWSTGGGADSLIPVICACTTTLGAAVGLSIGIAMSRAGILRNTAKKAGGSPMVRGD